jgi:hypothetical protein
MKKPKNADDYNWKEFRVFIRDVIMVPLDDEYVPLYWKNWKGGYDACLATDDGYFDDLLGC